MATGEDGRITLPGISKPARTHERRSTLLSNDDRQLLEAHTNLAWNETSGRMDIQIPAVANIAADTVGRHASSDACEHLALVFEQDDGSVRRWSFAEVDNLAIRLAAALNRRGVAPGDRIAVHTGLRPETGIAHMAIYKLGAVAVTLSQLYGPDTVHHVLDHAEIKACVTHSRAWERFRAHVSDFATLETVCVVGEVAEGECDFWACAAEDPGGFHNAVTGPEDAALLMYTSGSTGMPKGLMHGHRVLHAYSATINMFYNLELDDPELVMWTPSDWAWVGGLLDLLFPAWEHGQTVVTSEHRFDPEWVYGFLARHGVTHAFLAPTALKRLAEVDRPLERWDLKLRVVCTGGEALPSETFSWIEEHLGVVCNEFYGLTEVNHLVGNCRRLYPTKAGSMGRPYPGHRTELVSDDGEPVADGEVGMIVAPGDDPTRFLGYWKNPELTREMEVNGWLHTGDLASRDEDGYFWYEGRSDDLIKTAGYRVGPAEVENALLKHPAVAEAAVVASPDPARGNIVKAFVRIREGHEAAPELTEALQRMVKYDLAAYKYPREVEFVVTFPLTSSGKINRKALAQQERAAKLGEGGSARA